MIQHIPQAQKFAEELGKVLELHTVILDDWCGIRLIYETGDVRNCARDCLNCRTGNTLGEDTPAGTILDGALRTTLIKASARHTDVSTYPMLNCKTKADYMRSFLLWLLHRCKNAADFGEELDLIANFRVVFAKQRHTDIQRFELELEMKQNIVWQFLENCSDHQREIVRQYLLKIGRTELMDKPAVHYDLSEELH